MSKILIVEDEDMLSLILKDTLESKGHEIQIANDGNSAIAFFNSFVPEIVVLDIMIPGKSGYDVAFEIRKKNESVPIIFLSAKSQVVDVLKGFELGANDYLKKPFSMDELIARIHVLLKNAKPTRGNQVENEVYTIGEFIFDYSLQYISHKGTKATISFKESQLLKHLAKAVNQTVEKDLILKEIWGDNNTYTSKNMDVVITKLRTYFKADSRIKIINQRGVGYKLIVES